MQRGLRLSPATAPSFSGYAGLHSAGSDPEEPLAPVGSTQSNADLDQLGLDPAAIEPLAQGRDKWRALVNLVGSTHDGHRARDTMMR